MYPYTEDDALSEAELKTVLRGSVRKALTEYPDYSSVTINTHNEEERRLCKLLIAEEAEKLGDKCLRTVDCVIVLMLPSIQLGKIGTPENYLNC